MNVAARPLVPIAVCFALGIVAGQSGIAAVSLLIACVALGAATIRFSAHRLGLLAQFTAVAATGALRAIGTSGPGPDDVSRYAAGGYVTVTGTIGGDVE